VNKVFDLYGKYYDLLYKDKDYFSESEYINRLVEKFRPNSNSILDLGCGTGKHDIIFAENGFDVTGVELSENMIRKAKTNQEKNKQYLKLKFIRDDIRNLKLNRRFDIIFSLFHVMSYQTTNKDLLLTFSTVKEHLKEDGLFIFDFWYGPAVLNEKPERRVKVLEDEEIRIERFAEPVLRINENTVDVKYEMYVENKIDRTKNEIFETHNMRYLFIPEIKMFLSQLNMGIIHYEEWMTGSKLTDKSWSAVVLAGNKS